MKKIMLFSSLIALFGSFSYAYYQKKEAKPIVILPKAIPFYNYEMDEAWGDEPGDYAYSSSSEDTTIKGSFKNLLMQFPKEQLPYSLTINELREQAQTMTNVLTEAKQGRKPVERKIISRQFQRFFPNLDGSHFSRMPPPDGEPLMAFEVAGKHVLVYMTRRGGLTYYAATFTAKGKLIKETYLARARRYEFADATIDANLNLTQNVYSVTLEGDKNEDFDAKNIVIKELQFKEKRSESLLYEKKEEKEEEKNVSKPKP